jgi:hypothetical protein
MESPLLQSELKLRQRHTRFFIKLILSNELRFLLKFLARSIFLYAPQNNFHYFNKYFRPKLHQHLCNYPKNKCEILPSR